MSQLRVRGISSMIRDLRLVSDLPEKLEQQILAAEEPIDPSLLSKVELDASDRQPARAGDLVVFTVTSPGCYSDMETLWGERVVLHPGSRYLGVLCDRGSTKLLTAEISCGASLRRGTELQFVAQAGGVGWATGFSPIRAGRSGHRQPVDVEVVGRLRDRQTGRLVNTVEASALENEAIDRPQDLPGTVLVVGTATDVGKTTLATALIENLSRYGSCAALKASGTGWYRDTARHAQSGAFPALNFTHVGLPTTYGVPVEQYLRALHRLYRHVAAPESLPDLLLPPKARRGPRSRPQRLVIEHGGDLIWANVPTFLRDPGLMRPVRCLIIGSESAVSVLGALSELEKLGLTNSRQLRMFASVPLVNPQGFYSRLENCIALERLEGLVDVNKPSLEGEKERRCGYAASYERILSVAELAAQIVHGNYS